MRHKFTDADFAEFQNASLRLLKALGMNNWTLTFTAEELGRGVSARTRCGLVTREAEFTLTSRENPAPPDSSVPEIAAHEVLHLLLSQYGWAIAQMGGNLNHPIIAAHEHDVINRLIPSVTAALLKETE
jgi:hypothetical protein